MQILHQLPMSCGAVPGSAVSGFVPLMSRLQCSLAPLVLVIVLSVSLPAGQPQVAAAAAGYRARVLSVEDGDTLRVSTGGRSITIRMVCIDAPETAQNPHGVAARRYLQQRLRIGQEVTLQPKTIDRYGRTVAEVIRDININLVMVEDG